MNHNEAQKDAIFSTSNATLVLAGAGTGKTSVIINRIAHIINDQNVLPSQIIATTFTNKAAKELKDRLFKLIGQPALEIYCGTFHKISAQILRIHYNLIDLQSNFQVLTDDDQKRLIKNFLKELGKEEKPKVLIEKISKFKETGKKDNDILFNQIFEKYEATLMQNNLLDYSDLIKKCVFLFQNFEEVRNNLAKHILVDEYQDINMLQYEWIKLLSKKNTVFCVGDEDQSIYAFRGANIKYIQQFEQDFLENKIVKLEENYRSCHQILRGAVNLIGKNDKKFAKNLIAGNKELSGFIKITKVFNEYDEAEAIAKKIAEYKLKFPDYNIGILVRTNMQINYIEHALVEAKIPYSISGGKKFYHKKEVQDLVSYLRSIVFPHDFLAFSRIINTPKRGIGETKLEQFLQAMKSLNCNFETALNTLLPQLPKNTSEKCKIFLMQLQNWRLELKTGKKPIEILERILKDIKYIELEDIKDSKNINALKEQLNQYESITEFLENLSFMGEEGENEALQIMTMHAAKGLEFDIVISPGWEENIFPSMLSKTTNEIQEERRLAYVTITRAKIFLEIFYATSRKLNGRFSNQMPSRFIFDL